MLGGLGASLFERRGYGSEQERAVGLAGDVALEAPHRLLLGLALRGAPGDVLPCSGAVPAAVLAARGDDLPPPSRPWPSGSARARPLAARSLVTGRDRGAEPEDPRHELSVTGLGVVDGRHSQAPADPVQGHADVRVRVGIHAQEDQCRPATLTIHSDLTPPVAPLLTLILGPPSKGQLLGGPFTSHGDIRGPLSQRQDRGKLGQLRRPGHDAAVRSQPYPGADRGMAFPAIATLGAQLRASALTKRSIPHRRGRRPR